MTQKPLFDPGPAVTLTERQRFALDELRRTPGLTVSELGALVHQRAGKHDAGVRCEWCRSTGRELLAALRKKGVARKNRSGEWRALQGESQDVEGYDPSTAPIPF